MGKLLTVLSLVTVLFMLTYLSRSNGVRGEGRMRHASRPFLLRSREVAPAWRQLTTANKLQGLGRDPQEGQQVFDRDQQMLRVRGAGVWWGWGAWVACKCRTVWWPATTLSTAQWRAHLPPRYCICSGLAERRGKGACNNSKVFRVETELLGRC